MEEPRNNESLEDSSRASNNNIGATSHVLGPVPVKVNSKDIGYDYGSIMDARKKNMITCSFCQKVVPGGITRFKQHLIHKRGNTRGCVNVPLDVQVRVQKAVTEASNKKNQKIRADSICMSVDEDEEGAEEDDIEHVMGAPLPPHSSSATEDAPTSSRKRKEPSNVRGPMDLLVRRDSQKQQTLDASNPIKKKLKMEAWLEFSRWVYECGIPFNAMNNPRLATVFHKIGEYGRGLAPPTYYNVRVTLLKDVLKETQDFVDSFRPKWKEFGCSIMADFWTDGRRRSLINFLVNCPKGTVFLKSIDASDEIHSSDYIVGLFQDVIEDVGVDNVVQFITDNGSNFVAAGKKLEQIYPKLFWTPCAAHCINLMLGDIGKSIKPIKQVLARAKQVVIYIYNHLLVLNMMRKLSGTELHRSCVTRFATQFYTLESVWKNRLPLQQLFVSTRWVESSFSKKSEGRTVARIVARESFWKNVEFTCKVLAPLVDVLRLVDREEQPCMGYMYEAMNVAKDQLEKNLAPDHATFNKVWKIVDERWVDQLQHPLHAAGYYLNPVIVNKYTTSELNNARRLLFNAFEKLLSDNDVDLCMDQLSLYRDGIGEFGTPTAKRRMLQQAPYEWWVNHGTQAPQLQSFARRVLSQTCSASPCERNWSAFDNLHSKKRSCLLQQTLNNLVYIQYNMKLERRFLERRSGGKTYDPIILRDVEDNDDWITPTEEELQDFVRVGDDLRWEHVRAAQGGDDNVGPSRRSGRHVVETLDDEEMEQPLGMGEEMEASDDGDDDGGDEDEIEELY